MRWIIKLLFYVAPVTGSMWTRRRINVASHKRGFRDDATAFHPALFGKCSLLYAFVLVFGFLCLAALRLFEIL